VRKENWKREFRREYLPPTGNKESKPVNLKTIDTGKEEKEKKRIKNRVK